MNTTTFALLLIFPGGSFASDRTEIIRGYPTETACKEAAYAAGVRWWKFIQYRCIPEPKPEQ